MAPFKIGDSVNESDGPRVGFVRGIGTQFERGWPIPIVIVTFVTREIVRNSGTVSFVAMPRETVTYSGNAVLGLE